jgi:hypothetical protein
VIDAIGHALAAVCGERDVLARIGGVLGDCARAGLAHDQPKRAAAISVARAPVPPGLRGVDGSWIEAALAELPQRARAALAEGPISEADVWLVRRACAGLVPLPAIDPALARPRVPADVLRMSAAAVRGWLTEVGRDQLAFALGEHATALGDALAPAIARIARAPRIGELGPRRAAVERAQGEPFVIGVRAIAPHLEVVIARGLVLRFPHPEGLVLARELTAHAAARSAAWPALIAR